MASSTNLLPANFAKEPRKKKEPLTMQAESSIEIESAKLVARLACEGARPLASLAAVALERNADVAKRAEVTNSLPNAVHTLATHVPGMATFTDRELNWSTCSEHRRAEWLGSRFSLLRVARALLAEGADPERLRFSLTHNQQLSLVVGHENACMRGSTECVCALGVDMESSSRRISRRGAALFTKQSELKLGLSALQLWVIKEACFKANMPFSKDTIIADYEITAFNPKRRTGSAACKKKRRSFKFQLSELQGQTIAFALSTCRKKSTRSKN